MLYFFALIGVIAVGFLLWRAFGPTGTDRAAQPSRPRRPGQYRPGPTGPDDDPEFLHDLDRRARDTKGPDSDDVK